MHAHRPPPTNCPPLPEAALGAVSLFSQNSLVLIKDEPLRLAFYKAVICKFRPRALLILPSIAHVADTVCDFIVSFSRLNVQVYRSPLDPIPSHFDILIGTIHAFVNSSFRSTLTPILFSTVIVHGSCNCPFNRSFTYLMEVIRSGCESTSRVSVVSSDVPMDDSALRINPQVPGISQAILLHLDIHHQIIVSPDTNPNAIILPLLAAKKTPRIAYLYRSDIRHTPPGTMDRRQRIARNKRSIFFNRVFMGTAIPFTSHLVKLVLQMEHAVAVDDPTFQPQILSGGPSVRWGEYTRRQEALQPDPGIRALYKQLQHWYEALNLLILSWEQADWAGITLLRLAQCHSPHSNSVWPSPVNHLLKLFWQVQIPRNFQVLNRLRSILVSNAQVKAGCRTVVIVELEILAHVIDFYLRDDKSTHAVAKSVIAYSSKRSSSTLVMTEVQLNRNLYRFSYGNANVLVTTKSYAADGVTGFDFPFEPCVIHVYAGLDPEDMVQGPARSVNSTTSESDETSRTEDVEENIPLTGQVSNANDQSEEHPSWNSTHDVLSVDSDTQASSLNENEAIPEILPESSWQPPVGNYTPKLIPIAERSAKDVPDVDEQGIRLSDDARKALNRVMNGDGLRGEPSVPAPSRHAWSNALPSHTDAGPSRAKNHIFSAGDSVVEVRDAWRSPDRNIWSVEPPRSQSSKEVSSTKVTAPIPVNSNAVLPKRLNPSRSAAAKSVGPVSQETQDDALVLEWRFHGILTRPLDLKRKAHSSIYAFASKVGANVGVRHITSRHRFTSEMTYVSKARTVSHSANAESRKMAREQAANKLLELLITGILSDHPANTGVKVSRGPSRN